MPFHIPTISFNMKTFDIIISITHPFSLIHGSNVRISFRIPKKKFLSLQADRIMKMFNDLIEKEFLPL